MASSQLASCLKLRAVLSSAARGESREDPAGQLGGGAWGGGSTSTGDTMGAASDVIPFLSLIAAIGALLARVPQQLPGGEVGLDTNALVELVKLHAGGSLNEEEFSTGKARVLGPAAAPGAGAGAATHTWEDVAAHNTEADCWAVVVNEVYDFSCFFAAEPCFDHPGGKTSITKWCGGDATEGFLAAGHKPGIAGRKGVG